MRARVHALARVRVACGFACALQSRVIAIDAAFAFMGVALIINVLLRTAVNVFVLQCCACYPARCYAMRPRSNWSR